jgi:hypothetical protein
MAKVVCRPLNQAGEHDSTKPLPKSGTGAIKEGARLHSFVAEEEIFCSSTHISEICRIESGGFTLCEPSSLTL